MVFMKSSQGLHEQIVNRHPDRTAPVRVTAKETCGRFAWFISHRMSCAVEFQSIGLAQMPARQRSDSIVGEELAFIQHHS
jgi:hypothetical protein